MVTYDLVKIDALEVNSELNSSEQCDVCGSRDIIETYEGYACQECGIVLEVQKLEYHRPYDKDILQHAVINKTQIGTLKERSSLSSSVQFESLSKLNARYSHEEEVINEARAEIKRIITALKFPSVDVHPLLDRFKFIRSQIAKGTKYRTPTMLVPSIFFAFYKENSKPINERELLEVAHISKKDFNSFKLSILRIWPQYQQRNRKEYVESRIFELVVRFSLGLPFFYQSKRVLNKFYESVKNTKDDVIVGLVCSITLLCSQTSDCRVSHLCNALGIKMSTIQKQVEKKVFERFQLHGFRSLVKSGGLLKTLMRKLEVFEPEEELKQIELVQITIGSASPVFNTSKEFEYCLIIQDLNELLVTFVDVLDRYILNQEINDTSSTRNLSTVELRKYYSPVGPPV